MANDIPIFDGEAGLLVYDPERQNIEFVTCGRRLVYPLADFRELVRAFVRWDGTEPTDGPDGLPELAGLLNILSERMEGVLNRLDALEARNGQ